MRGGGFLHNRILLDPIDQQLKAARVPFWAEYYVATNDKRGFVDRFACRGSERLVIEAELTTKRIIHDVEKAAALQATALLIVMPTPTLVKSARALVRAHYPQNRILKPMIYVNTLGQSLQRLTDLLTKRQVP